MSVFIFWMSIVLLVLAFLSFLHSDNIEKKNNWNIVSFFCLLLAMIGLVANMFSNDVEDGEFAIHRDGQNLVIQSVPGTYWGYYQAYYFAKKTRLCKSLASYDSLGQRYRPESGCINYVLIPENFPKISPGGTTSFGPKNNEGDGQKNTDKLVLENNEISPLPSFIVATPEKK